MGFVVGVPHIAAVLTIVVIAFATFLFTGSPMAWLPTAIGTSLMVTHLVPVTGAGITISVVPALPALIVAFLIASRIRKAFASKATIKDLLICLAWVIGIPVVTVVIAWLILWDAGKVYDVAPPSLVAALPRVVLLHLAAMILGMGPKLWEALLSRYKIPAFVPQGVTVAARATMWLAAASLILFVIAAVMSIGRQQEIVNSYPNLDALGGVALFALSALYIPNAIMAIMAILVGSELNFGAASVSLFSVHTVPFPPLPLLGVIPGAVYTWAPALMVVVMAVFLFVMIRSKVSFLQALVAVVAAAAFMAGAAYLGSGHLAAYGYVGPTFLSAVGLYAIWIGVIGVAAAAVFTFILWRNGGLEKEEEAAPSAETAEAEAQSETDSETDGESEGESETATEPETDESEGVAVDGDVIEGEIIADDDDSEDDDSEDDAVEAAVDDAVSDADAAVAKPADEPSEEPVVLAEDLSKNLMEEPAFDDSESKNVEPQETLELENPDSETEVTEENPEKP